MLMVIRIQDHLEKIQLDVMLMVIRIHDLLVELVQEKMQKLIHHLETLSKELIYQEIKATL